MSDPYVREVGHVDWEVDDGVAGIPLSVGVDYGAVTIGGEGLGMTWRLDSAQMEELAQLLVAATWQAAWQTAVSLTRAAAGAPGADSGTSP